MVELPEGVMAVITQFTVVGGTSLGDENDSSVSSVTKPMT